MLLAFIFIKKKKFEKWAKIGLIATPKNYALKFSKRAKNGIFRFSFTRRIFWYAETHVLDEKNFFFRCNVKNRFFRGRTLVFLVPIDIESSYTYQNLLIDSAFQALSNGVPIDRSNSKKVGMCFEKNWTF